MACRSPICSAVAAATAASSVRFTTYQRGSVRLYAHRAYSLAKSAAQQDAALRSCWPFNRVYLAKTSCSGLGCCSRRPSRLLPLLPLRSLHRGFSSTSPVKSRLQSSKSRLRGILKIRVYRAWQKPLPEEIRMMLEKENKPGTTVLRNYKMTSKLGPVPLQTYFERFSKVKYRACQLSADPTACGEPVVIKVKGKECHAARRGVFVMKPVQVDPAEEAKKEEVAKARLESMGLAQEVYVAARYAIKLNAKRNKIVDSEAKKELAAQVSTPGSALLKPTPIQALAIPAILAGHRHIVLAAETGSGKTLAYLVPLIQKLKAEEEAAKESVIASPAAILTLRGGGPVVAAPTGDTTTASVLAALKQPTILRRPKRPRAIIVVPTRELILQILETAKDMAHIVKFTVKGVVSNTPPWVIDQIMSEPLDILISTPAAIIKLHKEKKMSFASARYLVIDEADSLLADGWINEVRQLINNVKESAKTQNSCYQMAMVSATLPDGIENVIRSDFPDAFRVSSPMLHQTKTSLRQKFIDIKSEFANNKEEALLRVIRESALRGDRRLMIFCNTKRCACYVDYFLQSRNINALLFHSHFADERREAVLAYFRNEDYTPFVPPPKPTWRRALEAARAEKAEDDDEEDDEEVEEYDEDDEEQEDEDEEEGEWIARGKKEARQRWAEVAAKRASFRAQKRKEAAEEKVLNPVAQKIHERFASGRLELPFPVQHDRAVPTSQRMKIMVCTDIAARGVDIPSVDHVVLFDFPKATVDYLHRVGRTARAGKVGRATSFIIGNERQKARDLLKAIKSHRGIIRKGSSRK